MSVLSLVMPFYRNPGMLALQMNGWAAWPGRVKRRTEIVIVDDGSPEAAAAVARPSGLPDLSIYRVLDDMPWHQHGARNLGAHVAQGPWLLLTDMDHVLPVASAESLLDRLDALDPGAIYTLDRVEADTGRPTCQNGRPKPHPNSFVVGKATFWKIGGYDETFTGIYGTDGLFRERAFAKARRGHLDVPLIRYWRDLVPDASTTTLKRKEGRDPGARRRVLEEKIARGERDHVRTLQFAWAQVL